VEALGLMALEGDDDIRTRLDGALTARAERG
jgi:hypothetical protein